MMLALSGLGLASASAAEKVHVGLFYAQNTPPAPEAHLAPEKLAAQLHEVFGFKHYELVKAGEVELRKEWEQWIIPRNDFFLRLKPLPTQPGAHRLVEYEIYKDGFIIAKGTYEPHPDIPLFINGPDFKQGRFIFVLEAK